jgi:hypothetical protein
MARLVLLDGVAAANGAPTAVQATGTITTVASANLAEGDYFVVDDGRRRVYFEFTKGGASGFVSGQPLVRIDVSAVLAAAAVKALIIAAINGAGLDITASDGGGAVTNLTHNLYGADGNRPVIEHVADAGFTVTGMANGALSGVRVAGDKGVLKSLQVRSVGCGAGQTLAGRLWGWWAADPSVHKPLGIGTGAAKGTLNGGAAFGLTNGNNVAHEEILRGGNMPDVLYLQLTGNFDGGTVHAELDDRNQPET